MDKGCALKRMDSFSIDSCASLDFDLGKLAKIKQKSQSAINIFSPIAHNMKPIYASQITKRKTRGFKARQE